MYRDNKQQKTNEGTTEAIDTEKKQCNGILQTSSSSKKTDKEPTKILQRTAQQATSVPPVTKIEIKDVPNERYNFDFDAYDDDLILHPFVACCIQKI